MGVLLGVPKRTIEIIEYENHGRAEEILCEYSLAVREKEDNEWGEQRKAELDVRCCYLQWQSIQVDAAPIINHPGRYINHAQAHHNANLLLKKPVWIGAPPQV